MQSPTHFVHLTVTSALRLAGDGVVCGRLEIGCTKLTEGVLAKRTAMGQTACGDDVCGWGTETEYAKLGGTFQGEGEICWF